MTVRGRGRKETLARKPHDFEKLRSPTNATSDWCGAGSVDYLALETSVKPGMLCLRASHLIDMVRRASWGKIKNGSFASDLRSVHISRYAIKIPGEIV